MNDSDRLIELAAEMEKPMERALNWKQIVDRYERGRNSKLGEIMMDLQGGEGVPKAVEGLKLWAYASEKYKEYLEEWDAAEKKMIIAKVEYETIKNAWESLRSKVAWARQAIGHGIQ